MEPIAIVTVLMLLQCFYFSFTVGQARGRCSIKAPATSGDPDFERHFRVHQNTVEQLVIVLPALWIFGHYVHPLIGAGLGLVFIVARIVYFKSYVSDPSARGKGFGLGALAMAILALGGLGGAIASMI